MFLFPPGAPHSFREGSLDRFHFFVFASVRRSPPISGDGSLDRCCFFVFASVRRAPPISGEGQGWGEYVNPSSAGFVNPAVN